MAWGLCSRQMKLELIHDDCLEAMTKIETGSIDMILTDLPYGKTKCVWDKPIVLDALWMQFTRVIKENGAIVLTAKQPFTTDLIMSNRDWFRYGLVWLKNTSTGYLNAKVMPLQNHEDICVFYKKKPKYNPIMEDGFERKTCKASQKRKCKAAEIYGEATNYADYESTQRYPISVLYFPSDRYKNSLHRTQKPVALMEYLIRLFTDAGDTVLDCCMGSGTTGEACMNLDRNFIGIEKDEEIFAIAASRLKHNNELGSGTILHAT